MGNSGFISNLFIRVCSKRVKTFFFFSLISDWLKHFLDFITGNEKADKEARIAADIQRECIQPISALDMKPYIKNQILSLWLEKWNSLTQNKLKKNGGKIGEKSFLVISIHGLMKSNSLALDWVTQG